MANDYSFALFDGVNRWYVANERDPDGKLKQALATPFNVLDRGLHGWTSISEVKAEQEKARSAEKNAWERELEKNSKLHRSSAGIREANS